MGAFVLAGGRFRAAAAVSGARPFSLGRGRFTVRPLLPGARGRSPWGTRPFSLGRAAGPTITERSIFVGGERSGTLSLAMLESSERVPVSLRTSRGPRALAGLAFGLSLVALGCGKGSASEETKIPSAGDSYAQSEARPVAEAPRPEAEDGPRPAPQPVRPPPAPGASASAPGADLGPPPKSHDLVYHVSPEGIWVEILKARFRPTAKVLKVPGGRVVEVELEVESPEPYVLIAGENGPMALSGRVRRPEEELRVDERGDSKVITLTPHKTEIYKRRFPAGSIKPVRPGDQLEIRIGLWGFGEDPDETLPVRRLFVVKMAPDKTGDHLEVMLPEGVSE